MKDIVIHVREDVCEKFGRDPEAVRLIEVAKEFGSVETLESALANERANHQAIVSNLTEQYKGKIAELEAEIEKIKEKGITAEELEVLQVIRKKAAKEKLGYEEALKSRDEQLKAVKLENENRATQIKALFNL